MTVEDLILDVEQSLEIKAPPDKVFAALLHRFGEGNTRPDGEPLHMLLEPKPGGRWYRDRGNGIGAPVGIRAGYQASDAARIERPDVHVVSGEQPRGSQDQEVAGGCKVTLRHRAIGMIDPEHRKGVSIGWNHTLAEIKKDCE